MPGVQPEMSRTFLNGIELAGLPIPERDQFTAEKVEQLIIDLQRGKYRSVIHQLAIFDQYGPQELTNHLGEKLNDTAGDFLQRLIATSNKISEILNNLNEIAERSGKNAQWVSETRKSLESFLEIIGADEEQVKTNLEEYRENISHIISRFESIRAADTDTLVQMTAERLGYVRAFIEAKFGQEILRNDIERRLFAKLKESFEQHFSEIVLRLQNEDKELGEILKSVLMRLDSLYGDNGESSQRIAIKQNDRGEKLVEFLRRLTRLRALPRVALIPIISLVSLLAPLGVSANQDTDGSRTDIKPGTQPLNGEDLLAQQSIREQNVFREIVAFMAEQVDYLLQQAIEESLDILDSTMDDATAVFIERGCEINEQFREIVLKMGTTNGSEMLNKVVEELGLDVCEGIAEEVDGFDLNLLRQWNERTTKPDEGINSTIVRVEQNLPPQKAEVIASGGLNARVLPDLDSHRVVTLYKDESFDVVARYGDWAVGRISIDDLKERGEQFDKIPPGYDYVEFWFYAGNDEEITGGQFLVSGVNLDTLSEIGNLGLLAKTHSEVSTDGNDANGPESIGRQFPDIETAEGISIPNASLIEVVGKVEINNFSWYLIIYPVSEDESIVSFKAKTDGVQDLVYNPQGGEFTGEKVPSMTLEEALQEMGRLALEDGVYTVKQYLAKQGIVQLVESNPESTTPTDEGNGGTGTEEAESIQAAGAPEEVAESGPVMISAITAEEMPLYPSYDSDKSGSYPLLAEGISLTIVPSDDAYTSDKEVDYVRVSYFGRGFDQRVKVTLKDGTTGWVDLNKLDDIQGPEAEDERANDPYYAKILDAKPWEELEVSKEGYLSSHDVAYKVLENEGQLYTNDGFDRTRLDPNDPEYIYYDHERGGFVDSQNRMYERGHWYNIVDEMTITREDGSQYNVKFIAAVEDTAKERDGATPVNIGELSESFINKFPEVAEKYLPQWIEAGYDFEFVEVPEFDRGRFSGLMARSVSGSKSYIAAGIEMGNNKKIRIVYAGGIKDLLGEENDKKVQDIYRNTALMIGLSYLSMSNPPDHFENMAQLIWQDPDGVMFGPTTWKIAGELIDLSEEEAFDTNQGVLPDYNPFNRTS